MTRGEATLGVAQRSSVSLTNVAGVHECVSPRQGADDSSEQHGGGNGASGDLPHESISIPLPPSLLLLTPEDAITDELVPLVELFPSTTEMGS